MPKKINRALIQGILSKGEGVKSVSSEAVDGSPDMTLRAWLAGQALAGLAANITIREYPMETAARAVELADETLMTLRKPRSAGEIK